MLLRGFVLLVGLRSVPGLQHRLPGQLLSSFSSLTTTEKMTAATAIATSSNFHRIEQSTVVPLYWYMDVSSTMDVAKDIAKERRAMSPSTESLDAFAVAAYSQSMGRGTRGRSWLSSRGNLYLTVVVKTKDIPIPLTLVPLRIATLIHHEIEQLLCWTDDSNRDSSSNYDCNAICTENINSSSSDSNSNFSNECKNVYLKWPNDILIDKKKVCGILMEMEDNNLLIGIGCNVVMAPVIENTGNNDGRQATCLKDHIQNDIDDGSSLDRGCEYPLTDRMAKNIVNRLSQWILSSSDCADNVVADFSKRLDWGTQYLRENKTEVIPQKINIDGTLEVCSLLTFSDITIQSFVCETSPRFCVQ